MKILPSVQLRWSKPYPTPMKRESAEKFCRLIGGRLPTLMDMETKLIGPDDPQSGLYWVARPVHMGRRPNSDVVWNAEKRRGGGVELGWLARVRCVQGSGR